MSTMSSGYALQPCCESFQKPSTEVCKTNVSSMATCWSAACYIYACGFRSGTPATWFVGKPCQWPLGSGCFEYEYRAHGADLAYQCLLSGPRS